MKKRSNHTRPSGEIAVTVEGTPYREELLVNVRPGGGTMQTPLPFLRGTVDGLSLKGGALVATADLQGRVEIGRSALLAGHWLAETLRQIQEASGLPPPSACLGVLGGDFYAVPDAAKMGGTGDVTIVWDGMRRCFGALGGVAGNHDLFADNGSPEGALDGDCVELAGIRIGGVSGIVGQPRKENRRTETQYRDLLTRVVMKRPNVLVLHLPPHVDEECPGDPMISATLQELRFHGLVVCGHKRWSRRVRQIGRAVCLNVCEAVVTLIPK